MQTFRYNSGEGTIKEIDGSDNEVSVYDNVPRSNSGGSRRFRKNQHQSRHLKPSSPTGSRKSRKSRKSSGGSTIDRIRYFLKENEIELGKHTIDSNFNFEFAYINRS